MLLTKVMAVLVVVQVMALQAVLEQQDKVVLGVAHTMLEQTMALAVEVVLVLLVVRVPLQVVVTVVTA
jgi:hypothetical protein